MRRPRSINDAAWAPIASLPAVGKHHCCRCSVVLPPRADRRAMQSDPHAIPPSCNVFLLLPIDIGVCGSCLDIAVVLVSDVFVKEGLHLGGVEQDALSKLFGWLSVANSAKVENLE